MDAFCGVLRAPEMRVIGNTQTPPPRSHTREHLFPVPSVRQHPAAQSDVSRSPESHHHRRPAGPSRRGRWPQALPAGRLSVDVRVLCGGAADVRRLRLQPYPGGRRGPRPRLCDRKLPRRPRPRRGAGQLRLGRRRPPRKSSSRSARSASAPTRPVAPPRSARPSPRLRSRTALRRALSYFHPRPRTVAHAATGPGIAP
jgi:hypothetical protein